MEPEHPPPPPPAAPPPVAPPAPAPPAAYPYPSSYYYPPGSNYRTESRTSGEAMGALICGIAAWFCFPLGFVAVYLGIRARQQARENPELAGGDQLALAGMIMGGVLAGLQTLLVLLYVLLIGAAFGFSYFNGP